MEHFDSVADMKAATEARLIELPGIGKKKAEAIRSALQKL